MWSWLIKFKRVTDFETIWKIFVEARKYFWNWANIRFEATKVPILGKLGRRLRNIENILEFSSYLNASPSIIYMKCHLELNLENVRVPRNALLHALSA